MSRSDEEYVQSCLDGHAEAFRHLVDRYQSPLTRCLSVRLGNLGEAAEAAQETFVRAYFSLGKLRKPRAFFAWLLGIAERVAKEARRTARRNRSVDLEQVEPAEPTGQKDGWADTAITEAVATLPEVYREVILLRFYAERSCAEISHDLDVPLGTVTKRLSRAYVLLREHLGPTLLSGEDEVSR